MLRDGTGLRDGSHLRNGAGSEPQGETRGRERWCVHIPGPDDLYPQESREAAEALAKSHNEWAEANLAERWKDPLYPCRESCLAVVIPWPHGDVSDELWARMVEDAKQP